jgi:surfeit locus 1 family protein
VSLRKLVILLVTLVAVITTASLGAWQMRRAAYKQAISAEILDKNQQFARINADLFAIKNIVNEGQRSSWIEAETHRRAELKGRWLDQHTVFLDNRQMKGRVGFYVATPLLLEGSQDVIWVQRGFAPRDFQDRSRVPALPPSGEGLTVPGRLIAQIARTYELEAKQGTEGAAPQASTPPVSSRIWQNLPQIQLEAGMTLLPIALLQTQAVDAADNLQRDWPAIDTGVAKHHGYAFQWFALCALLIALYVWFQIIQPRRKSRDASAHEQVA